MNVKPGPGKVVSWWMAYLNFQIEHHLFPSMPQVCLSLAPDRRSSLFAPGLGQSNRPGT
jgi:fatty acid desaturase